MLRMTGIYNCSLCIKIAASCFTNHQRDATTNKVVTCFLLVSCLQGGGQPQIGEVTCGGQLHLSCKRDQIKMTDYMNRRVTPPKRVTSSDWGPSPPCKPALSYDGNNQFHKSNLTLLIHPSIIWRF